MNTKYILILIVAAMISEQLLKTASALVNFFNQYPETKEHGAQLEQQVGRCLATNWNNKQCDAELTSVLDLYAPIYRERMPSTKADTSTNKTNTNAAAEISNDTTTQQTTTTRSRRTTAGQLPVRLQDYEMSDDDDDDESDSILSEDEVESVIPNDLYDVEGYNSEDDDDFDDGLDSDDDMFGDDDDMLSFCTDISDDEVEELNNDDGNTIADADTNTTTTTQQLPKKRGRPKGSTNKKKKSKGWACKKKEGDKNDKKVYHTNKRARRSRTSNQNTNASNNTNSTDTLKSTDSLDLIEVRLLISYYYVFCLDAPPPNEWTGHNGTISIICDELRLEMKNNYKKVRTVIRTTYRKIKKKEKYYGLTNWRGGRKSTIAEGSEEEQILATKKEDGCSFTQVMEYINENRADTISNYDPADDITRSAVISRYNKMSKVVTPINKRCQGNSNKESDWAKARYRWVTQLLIRLNLAPDDLSAFTGDNGTLEKCFDSNELSKYSLCLNAIAWWDEVHKKCHIGDKREGAKDHVQFPRNAEGKYDPNGHYSEEEKGIVFNPKYPDEGRFCLGVAIDPTPVPEGEDRKGVRLELFDYSKMTILSIQKWKEKVDQQIREVKEKGGKKWVVSQRLPNGIYRNDPISIVNNRDGVPKMVDELGDKSFKHLNAQGINTVQDAIDLADDEVRINEIVNTIKATNKGTRVSYERLKALSQGCKDQCQVGDSPSVVYHNRADNPYESLYGDNWEDEIAKEIKGYTCITKLVTHVVLESKKLYEGTQYEDSWMFYHDALSLMTDKSCVEWMKKQYIDESNTISYYDKWILPVLGLNDQYTRYKGRPIGNSPEMMPLDNCLNKDLHELVARHVLMSRASAINKDDPRIFSLSTYKKVSNAYKRIWSPTSGVGPPSKRIVQDITKVVDAMKQIYKQEGAFVPDIAQRPGDRHIINQLKSKIWGGKRTKKEVLHILFADREDLHEDLKAILAEEKSGM